MLSLLVRGTACTRASLLTFARLSSTPQEVFRVSAEGKFPNPFKRNNVLLIGLVPPDRNIKEDVHSVALDQISTINPQISAADVVRVSRVHQRRGFKRPTNVLEVEFKDYDIKKRFFESMQEYRGELRVGHPLVKTLHAELSKLRTLENVRYATFKSHEEKFTVKMQKTHRYYQEIEDTADLLAREQRHIEHSAILHGIPYNAERQGFTVSRDTEEICSKLSSVSEELSIEPNDFVNVQRAWEDQVGMGRMSDEVILTFNSAAAKQPFFTKEATARLSDAGLTLEHRVDVLQRLMESLECVKCVSYSTESKFAVELNSGVGLTEISSLGHLVEMLGEEDIAGYRGSYSNMDLTTQFD